MRDYTSRIYRAKRKNNGEWVYGYLWCGASSTYITPYNLGVNYDEKMHKITATAYEVDPDTIGQYIRLNDKNGKKAFTGDITMDPQGRKWVIFDCPGGFGTCNPWQWENHLSGDPTFLYSSLSDRQSADWFTRYNTIIGNIHDNPELLEEAAPC